MWELRSHVYQTNHSFDRISIADWVFILSEKMDVRLSSLPRWWNWLRLTRLLSDRCAVWVNEFAEDV